jgi:hypothetical protein
MPWKKGQSGNPGGRSKGARTKLSDAFIRILARDWEKHGESVVSRVRESDPATYMRVIAGLLPKDVTLDATVEQAVSVRGLPATEELFREFTVETPNSTKLKSH